MTPRLFALVEVEAPTSLDPLDADYFNNLHASQMVHQTLLEVKSDNSLESSLLEHFSYNPERAEVRFVLNPTAQFSDGSSITAHDLEMTVKRMVLKRPEFPVLRHIVGVAAWATQPQPLAIPLEGVTTSGNELRIRFTRDIPEPLYRFALPLFGVVKAESVDFATNKLKSGYPTSGFYREVGRESVGTDVIVQFLVTEEEQNRPSNLPKKVNLRYHPSPLSGEWLGQLGSEQVVIVSPEGAMDNRIGDVAAAGGFGRLEQPSSRFSVFLLSSQTPAFRDRLARLVFREVALEALKEEAPHMLLETSILSRILPGYMTRDELRQKGYILTDAERKRAREALKGKALRWMPTPNQHGPLLENVMKSAVSKLAMEFVSVSPTDAKERFKDFAEGRLDVLVGGSGFWAFDPVGDLQMLFTPNLHKPLMFVSQDSELQKLLTGLEFEEDPSSRLRQVNIHLHDHGLFNVFSHAKRVYYVKGLPAGNSIPIAITPPAPWQVFRDEP